MGTSTDKKIILIKTGGKFNDIDTFGSKAEMITKLCKSGDTFGGCGYGTFEHFQGIDDLIRDIKKVKSNLKSEMVSEVDYPNLEDNG